MAVTLPPKPAVTTAPAVSEAPKPAKKAPSTEPRVLVLSNTFDSYTDMRLGGPFHKGKKYPVVGEKVEQLLALRVDGRRVFFFEGEEEVVVAKAKEIEEAPSNAVTLPPPGSKTPAADPFEEGADVSGEGSQEAGGPPPAPEPLPEEPVAHPDSPTLDTGAGETPQPI